MDSLMPRPHAGDHEKPEKSSSLAQAFCRNMDRVVEKRLRTSTKKDDKVLSESCLLSACPVSATLNKSNAQKAVHDAIGTSQRGRPLAEQVETLEMSLGIAFREHRQRVEEILEIHMEAMDDMDANHHLLVSKLKTENGMLREKLNLSSSEPSGELYQTVALQHAEDLCDQQNGLGAVKGDRVKDGKNNRKDLKKLPKDEDDTEGDLHIRSKKDKKEQPRGAWQQFVAWVPNAAALNAPVPWQPIPPENLISPPESKICKRVGMGATTEPTAPGWIRERATEDEDAEGETQEESSHTKKVYKVVEVFVATQLELEASRRSMVTKAIARQETKMPKNISARVSSPEDEEGFFGSQQREWWIIHPHSKVRAMWDLASLALVVWDLISIPMEAFDLPKSSLLDFMKWLTRIFWTLDMGMSCATGVVLKDGAIELDKVQMIKRYLKTWFPFDVLVVSTDWTDIISDNENEGGTLSAFRSFRTIRVLRLMRMVRMKEFMEQMAERIQGDKLAFLLSIVKMVIFVASLAHLVACGWWFIGDTEEPDSWVSNFGYTTRPLTAQYLMSLHWSLSQFTGGMDEVTPVRSTERFYAVLMWKLAFISAAVVTSVLTSNLTQLHIIGGSRSRQLSLLRKYLKQNSISSNLALRMQRSAQHALSADLTPDLVELLPVISEPLRIEMHFEMYTAILNHHGFFNTFACECPQVMRRICHYGLSTILLANSDIVFSRGENPSSGKMYVVVKGLCEYNYVSEVVPCHERQFISEATLWTRWTYQGTLTSVQDTKLAIMDAKTFQDIADRFKDATIFDPKLYAADFVAQLNAADVANDLTITKFKY